MGDHRIQAQYKQLSEVASTLHALYRLFVGRGGGGENCIYGTYVVPPVGEGLTVQRLKSGLNLGRKGK